MEFEEMVRFAVENGASDIHLASNNLPSYRKNGKIMSYKGAEILDEDTVMKYIDEVLEPADYLKFCNTGDIDSAYQFEDLARFRVNAFKQRCDACNACNQIESSKTRRFKFAAVYSKNS